MERGQVNSSIYKIASLRHCVYKHYLAGYVNYTE